jgi:diguanylate cyclase (GGDEF)-like protein
MNNNIGNMLLNIYSMALLILLLYKSETQGAKDVRHNRLYIRMLWLTGILLVVDMMGRMDGYPDTLLPLLNRTGNFLLFLLSPVAPTVWLMYIHARLGKPVDRRYYSRLLLPLCAVNAINLALLTATQFNGWYYTFSADNIYSRGPLNLVPNAMGLLLLAAGAVMAYRNRKLLDKRHALSLILFSLPSFIAVVLQYVFYGYSLIINCIALSLVIIYINVQDYTLFTDYLTGVNNRQKLEVYLKQRIQNSGNQGFSAIMLDLDGFKTINDTFGHEMGDKALREAAELLAGCLRSRDMVARYGGDEFCIVLDTADKSVLNAIGERIREAARKFSGSGSNVFSLSFSMGSAIYNKAAHKDLKGFLGEIDRLMYENKHRPRQ